mmetsp:Transcript_24606/g.62694  ORF Transcript_24606/g.62694 Transcript_24606/m.62694 type:complete len:152 (-) Transcript_24606:483-938(-)
MAEDSERPSPWTLTFPIPVPSPNVEGFGEELHARAALREVMREKLRSDQLQAPRSHVFQPYPEGTLEQSIHFEASTRLQHATVAALGVAKMLRPPASSQCSGGFGLGKLLPSEGEGLGRWWLSDAVPETRRCRPYRRRASPCLQSWRCRSH